MSLENVIHFRNRQEWRDWLLENHNKVNEAWLTHYKKHTRVNSVSLDDAVEEALCFGWIDGKLQNIDEDRYIVRYSPRRRRSVWSKINKDRAEKLIRSGQMTAAGLARVEEARKNGLWDAAYTSLTSDIIPADLEAALRQDKSAWTNFRNFANSYRNNYIGWINNARNNKTRQRRITEVVDRSRRNIKPGIQ